MSTRPPTAESLALLGAGTNSELVARLLDRGADPNVVHPRYGSTPLYNACFADCEETVALLIAGGADPNQRITYRSPVDRRVESGVVALMCARSLPVVAALIAAGADVNAADRTGRTVLMRCALSAPPPVVGLLIGAGADVAARDRYGRTARDHVELRLAWYAERGVHRGPGVGTPREAALTAIHHMLRLTPGPYE